MLYVSEIFDDKPERWGLRGDPDFWEYLKNHFTDIRLPYSEKAFDIYVREAFKTLTGSYPEEGKHYFVKSFAAIHKGMSTGFLSGDFWLKQAIPLLIERMESANNEVR